MTEEEATAKFGGGRAAGASRWANLWSAGHSVSGVKGVPRASDVVARLRSEYAVARAEAVVA